MTLSDLSVRRPVFAAVAAIILCVVGVAAFTALPVRELPNVDPPQVSISTTYTGASAEVIEERITQVIEQQVAGIQGDRPRHVLQPRRALADQHHLHPGPQPGRGRQRRARRGLASGLAPAVAGVFAPDRPRPTPTRQPIMLCHLTSKTMNRLAAGRLRQPLSGGAAIHDPGRRPQVYVWRRPALLHADLAERRRHGRARGLTVEDVESALNAQNVELPAGALESTSKDFTIG